MDGPGISLFQGNELRLNQTNPEEEEAEQAEEERRKNAELRNLLNGAFDDLEINDADLSFTSSKNLNDFSMPTGGVSSEDELVQTNPKRLTNGLKNGLLNNGDGAELSAHYNHCYHNKGSYVDSSASSSPTKRKVVASGDAQQLVTLYEVRMREIVRLQDLLEANKQEANDRIERLGHKILQLEAEKVATNRTLSQTQSLLVSAKEQVQELKNEVDSLRKHNQELNDNREELEQDRLIMRANIESLNSKLLAMEKISSETSGARQADMIVRSLEERHHKEIISYQVQIEELKEKLSNASDNIRSQERRNAELSRQQEAMLLEKAETINGLSRALAQSQQHCQELIAADKTNSSGEIRRLKDTIKQQESAIEKYKIDIDHLETLVGLNVLTSDSAEAAKSAKASFYKTGLDSVDSLREELAKSLRYHESRRAEIRQLRYIIQEKENAAKDWAQQEDRYKAELAQLKEECDKLATDLARAKVQPSDDHLSKDNLALKEKVSHLETAIERLQAQNTQLAENTVELQRICDEEKLKVIDDHSREYLRFHHDAVAQARQEERDKMQTEIQKLKCELELALEDADKSKQAYINLVTTKNAVAMELESQRKILGKLQNQVGSTSNPKHELGDMQLAVYEERVRREIENAKKEMLEEIMKEKESLKAEAKLEAEKDLQIKILEAVESSRNEWLKDSSGSKIREELEAEVERLKKQLEKQVEEAKLQKKQLEDRLWSHFHEELMRLDQFQADSKLRRASDVASELQNENDSSLRKTHSLNNLETRAELEECVKKLSHELEETKKVHSQRLIELQELLFTKQKEMEEFKHRMLEYTRSLHEGREKQNEQYIAALKKEIECLNEELGRRAASEDLLRLKNEKRKAEEEAIKLRKSVEKYKERMIQAKDYYERRENLVLEQFKQKEREYFDLLLKLKSEVDSFDILAPKYNGSSDHPDHPVKL